MGFFEQVLNQLYRMGEILTTFSQGVVSFFGMTKEEFATTISNSSQIPTFLKSIFKTFLNIALIGIPNELPLWQVTLFSMLGMFAFLTIIKWVVEMLPII